MPVAFPRLGEAEFEQGCVHLLQRFQCVRSMQTEWLSAEKLHRHGTVMLRITKPLTRGLPSSNGSVQDADEVLDELDDLVEDDEEALNESAVPPTIVVYDAVLSPVYQVPVLYFGIQDSLHRYPPTMATLYDHLVMPHFRPQTQDTNTGVIGGISMAEHPITNTPVFFIHPCQTAQVMQASLHKDTTAEAYLIAWIGALGKPVGLNIPLLLAQQL